MGNNLWAVYDYEVNQLCAMCDLLRVDNPILKMFSQEIRNAIVESALIHTRILVGILLSEPKDERSGWDDFKVEDLVPSFQSNNVDRLRAAYSKSLDGASPRSVINKRLAHASRIRSDSHDYSPILEKLLPIIHDLVAEIERQRPPQ